MGFQLILCDVHGGCLEVAVLAGELVRGGGHVLHMSAGHLATANDAKLRGLVGGEAAERHSWVLLPQQPRAERHSSSVYVLCAAFCSPCGAIAWVLQLLLHLQRMDGSKVLIMRRCWSTEGSMSLP
jgi:hypothetical protein